MLNSLTLMVSLDWRISLTTWIWTLSGSIWSRKDSTPPWRWVCCLVQLISLGFRKPLVAMTRQTRSWLATTIEQIIFWMAQTRLLRSLLPTLTYGSSTPIFHLVLLTWRTLAQSPSTTRCSLMTTTTKSCFKAPTQASVSAKISGIQWPNKSISWLVTCGSARTKLAGTVLRPSGAKHSMETLTPATTTMTTTLNSTSLQTTQITSECRWCRWWEMTIHQVTRPANCSFTDSTKTVDTHLKLSLVMPFCSNSSWKCPTMVTVLARITLWRSRPRLTRCPQRMLETLCTQLISTCQQIRPLFQTRLTLKNPLLTRPPLSTTPCRRSKFTVLLSSAFYSS